MDEKQPMQTFVKGPDIVNPMSIPYKFVITNTSNKKETIKIFDAFDTLFSENYGLPIAFEIVYGDKYFTYAQFLHQLLHSVLVINKICAYPVEAPVSIKFCKVTKHKQTMMQPIGGWAYPKQVNTFHILNAELMMDDYLEIEMYGFERLYLELYCSSSQIIKRTSKEEDSFNNLLLEKQNSAKKHSIEQP